MYIAKLVREFHVYLRLTPAFLLIALCARAGAQAPAACTTGNACGVYLYTRELANNIQPPPARGCSGTGCTPAGQLVEALATEGVDGLTLVMDWSLIEPYQSLTEPFQRKYIWDTGPANALDGWINLAASLGKNVNMVIRAGGGDSGKPRWTGCFKAPPAIVRGLRASGPQPVHCGKHRLAVGSAIHLAVGTDAFGPGKPSSNHPDNVCEGDPCRK